MTFLTNCFVIATMVVIGEVLLYFRLPIWTRKLICRTHVIVDIGVSYGAYTLIGHGTVTGIFAAAMVGIATSLLLTAQRRTLLGIRPRNRTYSEHQNG